MITNYQLESKMVTITFIQILGHSPSKFKVIKKVSKEKKNAPDNKTAKDELPLFPTRLLDISKEGKLEIIETKGKFYPYAILYK
jgi:hypothetical protein